MFISVDLPEPEVPMKATLWLRGMDRSMPRSAWMVSSPITKRFSMPSSFSSDWLTGRALRLRLRLRLRCR